MGMAGGGDAAGFARGDLAFFAKAIPFLTIWAAALPFWALKSAILAGKDDFSFHGCC